MAPRDKRITIKQMSFEDRRLDGQRLTDSLAWLQQTTQPLIPHPWIPAQVDFEAKMAEASKLLGRPLDEVKAIHASTAWNVGEFRDACAMGWSPKGGFPRRHTAFEMAETVRKLETDDSGTARKAAARRLPRTISWISRGCLRIHLSRSPTTLHRTTEKEPNSVSEE